MSAGEGGHRWVPVNGHVDIKPGSDGIEHAPVIGAFCYRNVMLCGRCVTPEEHRMTGQFWDWKAVRGSGWTCERCGVDLESLEPRGREKG